jgi:hypothetical protein
MNFLDASMKFHAALTLSLAFTTSLVWPLCAADDDAGITWLVNYDGSALPGGEWTPSGKPAATVE